MPTAKANRKAAVRRRDRSSSLRASSRAKRVKTASSTPAITGDGRFVAFQSNAQSFTPVAQTGFFSDVFVRDREAGTTVLVDEAGMVGTLALACYTFATREQLLSLEGSGMGETLADTLSPFSLDHPACWTCHAYGVSCKT